MLTCAPRSKQPDEHDESNRNGDTPAGKKTKKKLGSQIKDMALKATGAYRSCTPCTGQAMILTPQQQLQKSNDAESDLPASNSERFRWPYRRTGSKNSSSGRVWGKEMEARLKGISMGSGGGSEVAAAGTLSASASGRRAVPIVLMEEIEPKEWVAQVEPGVLITFISLPNGGNDLKQIRFSREMFNKWQAQRWWKENFDKVMELYNVKRLSRQAFPLPTPPNSEDEPALDSRHNPKTESIEDSLVISTLSKEILPNTLQPDHHKSTPSYSNRESTGLSVTRKLSDNSGTKTESSSMDASISATSSKEADQSEELSISNVSDADNEWVEEDEPGVYITIKVLPGGSRELRRVRFSREKFGEVHARLWWEENRARIHKQYL